MALYNDHDRARYAPERPRQVVPTEGDTEYRTPFQIDRDRIIHSEPFRRLQSKTQVFQPGEYDFYRTRLTHSMEVAQIGRSLCAHLRYQTSDAAIDIDLIEAVCLAHDLGHPPFGHAGERTLNRLMADWGGFEGNAQTVRLLTALFYDHGTKGMAPTRALLDGVMKYKTLRRELVTRENPTPKNHFLYDDQEPVRTFATEGAPSEQKSLECDVMDWADDTAYSLNDMVDGVRAGFIDLRKLEELRERKPEIVEAAATAVEDFLRAIRKDQLEAFFGRKIGEFIRGSQILTKEDDSLPARYRLKLSISPAVATEAKVFARIAVELIFSTPTIQQFEYKADSILTRLFLSLVDNYTGKTNRFDILSRHAADWIDEASGDQPEQMRRICDHLACMTDRQAIALYRRLFDPGFGSIADLV